ncbi:hypothetical protein [Rhizobium sp. PP-CC-3G-465]|uniref:hypothetical protein n=1 Tax=Rhizobium sp. PP-CC-3G-465 TaxID=2135648 RepID=UPI001047683A|nr:hypothetical protein C8J33_11643 [Rhizobium sp. PP-CC-3G-465]
MPPKKKEQLGLYPNLREHRTKLGLSIKEFLAKVENAPSEKSVRRLENGVPIRLTTVNKLFNSVSSFSGFGSLVRENEINVIEL